MCGLFNREAAKRAKLHNPGQRRVDRLQSIERVIKRESRHFVRRGDVLGFVEGNTTHAVATLAGAVPSRVIDQDAAHDLRRDTKEMRPILPIDVALVDQSKVHLMNEGRRLQGMVRPLLPQLARGHAAQLRIDERQQPVEGRPVAAAPVAEQSGDVASRKQRSLLQPTGFKHMAWHWEDNRPAPVPLTRYDGVLRDLL
jgi:hypothetical protein